MDAARHFGLAHDPFTALIDPTDAFDSTPFRTAREQLLGELQQGARLIMLIGAAGTGKTLLLRRVEMKLRAAGRRVMRIDRGDLVPKTILDVDDLLIDEASRMNRETLAELVRNAGDPSHPAVVAACIDRCLDGLAGPVPPRVVTLSALGPADARDMVLDRISRVGGKPSLFAPGALSAVTYAAAGSPRRLRLLSSGALFHAAQDSAQQVEMSHARRAIAMQNGRFDEASLPPDPEAVPLDLSPRAERMEVLFPPAQEPEPTAAPSETRSRAGVAAAPTVLAAHALGPSTIIPDPVSASEPEILPEREAAVPESAVMPSERRWFRPVAFAGTAMALIAGGLLLLPRTATEGAPPIAAPAVVKQPPTDQPDQPASAVSVMPAPPQVAESMQAVPATIAPAVLPETAPVSEPTATGGATPRAIVPPTVVVRYPPNEPGAADAARRVADLLRARGYEVAALVPAPSSIVNASIRYSKGAGSEAEALNDVLEQALQAYQPGATSRTIQSREADPGRFEVWVPNSAATASRPLRLDAPPD